MATNDDHSFPNSISDEIVHFEVRPGEIGHFPPGRYASSEFRIAIAAKFTRRRAVAVSEEQPPAGGPDVIIVRRTLPLLLCMLSTSGTCGFVRDILAYANVVRPQAGVEAVADKILDCCCRMACDAPPYCRVLHMSVDIDLLVDELPEPVYNDDEEDEDVGEDEDEDDEEYDEEGFDVEELRGFSDGDERHAEVRFAPASEEAIEGLERIRVGWVSERPCVVCLEDISGGSEAIRLPCSHYFHGDCIVQWLKSSKFCPLCRYQMS